MKPKMLKIEGLNSFEKEQKIDFEKLTAKGLFGIFGPTGSGKSTILDGITIALYGKITRTNKGYINTTTKNLNVSYEFEIGLASQRKTYLAQRNLRIDKHGAYKTRYARLIEKDDCEDNIIAEGPKDVQRQIEKIIGLKCDDFTRSVVLPQGKFSEFLKLNGKERRDMLERIFALEKYGRNLMDKIKKSRNEKLKEENILTGELKKYEGISDEVFELKKKELKESTEEENVLKNIKKDLDEKYDKYKNIYELQNELEYYEKINRELCDKKEEYILKNQNLDKAKKALSVKPIMDELDKINNNMKEKEQQLIKQETDLKFLQEQLRVTEEEYNEVLHKKEEQIPELIKTETNLVQALEVNKRIETLKLERQKLRDNYSEAYNSTKSLEKELDILKNNKKKNLNRIETIDNRLKEISFDLEYREKAQICFQKKNEYKQLEASKNDLMFKINNKEKEITQKEDEYRKIVQNQVHENNLVLELESKIKKLEKSYPGDSSMLLEKSQSINLCEKKLEFALDNDNKRKKLKQKLKEVSDNKKPIQENLVVVENNLERRELELQNISGSIDEINKKNLANILASELKEGEPCPVCGATHHVISAKPIDRDALEQLEEEKTHIEVVLKNMIESLNNFRIKLISYEKEEEQILHELKEIEEILKDINIDNLKEEKDSLQKDFIIFKDRINQYNKEKEALDNDIKCEKEKKAHTDMIEARLNQVIKSEKIFMEELKKDLVEQQKKLHKIYDEYVLLKEELNIEDINFTIENIKNADKECVSLKNEEKQMRVDITKIDENMEILNKKINELKIVISEILQSGKEKGSVIKSSEEEFNKLTQGKKPEEYIEIVRNQIKDINEKSNLLKSKLENYKTRKQEISNAKLSIEQAIFMLSDIKKSNDKKLKDSLKENEFKDESEVIRVMLDEIQIESIEKDVLEYQEKLKNIGNNILRVKEKLDGEYIEKDEWERIKKDRIEKEELLNIKIKEIASLQKTLDDMKKDIEDLKILKNKEKEIVHRLSILNDLSKLIEGNKFVEFVAMNQLKYIAREASRRLKSITRDRYALEIDSEGNFTIRDDFNGGQIRETSTLSGGETFLTSLSLALALSSQVQLKGSAPLEFFFLDEGFGTLDSDLLDIVMNSLEKLHSNKLSVGIISHVEELKNRVPVKLIVTPAKQGISGSNVKLEYS